MVGVKWLFRREWILEVVGTMPGVGGRWVSRESRSLRKRAFGEEEPVLKLDERAFERSRIERGELFGEPLLDGS